MTPERIESSPTAAVPAILASWLTVFRPFFTASVWNHILVLVAGAVLAPGKRTVTQALRVMGLADQPGFGRYHEALNRARHPGAARIILAGRRAWVDGRTRDRCSPSSRSLVQEVPADVQ